MVRHGLHPKAFSETWAPVPADLDLTHPWYCSCCHAVLSDQRLTVLLNIVTVISEIWKYSVRLLEMDIQLYAVYSSCFKKIKIKTWSSVRIPSLSHISSFHFYSRCQRAACCIVIHVSCWVRLQVNVFIKPATTYSYSSAQAKTCTQKNQKAQGVLLSIHPFIPPSLHSSFIPFHLSCSGSVSSWSCHVMGLPPPATFQSSMMPWSFLLHFPSPWWPT